METESHFISKDWLQIYSNAQKKLTLEGGVVQVLIKDKSTKALEINWVL